MVSYQVVQEWFNVVLRKAATPLTADEAAPSTIQAASFSTPRSIFTAVIPSPGEMP